MIGVISDTHGLMRAEVLSAFQEVELILHAGDAGNSRVIEALREIAPVFSVRGNMDKGPWAEDLPATRVVQIGGQSIFVLHDIARLDLDPSIAGFSAVIYGHSHRPSAEYRAGVLYLNPGAAGPKRFNLPVSVARLHLGEKGIASYEFIQLVPR